MARRRTRDLRVTVWPWTRSHRRAGGLSLAAWIAIDCACTALMLLVYVELKAAPFLRGIPLWAAADIVVAGVVPAALRRRWPRAVLALVVTAGGRCHGAQFFPCSAAGAAFVMYVIPLRFARRDALWLLGGTLLVMAAGLAAFAATPHGAGLQTGTACKSAGLSPKAGSWSRSRG